MTTPEEVAAFMLAELRTAHGYLEQHVAASAVEQRFGAAFALTSDSGNLVIAPPVLKAFRHLTKETVEWVREEKAWRERG